jgi:hypothetical protein
MKPTEKTTTILLQDEELASKPDLEEQIIEYEANKYLLMTIFITLLAILLNLLAW